VGVAIRPVSAKSITCVGGGRRNLTILTGIAAAITGGQFRHPNLCTGDNLCVFLFPGPVGALIIGL